MSRYRADHCWFPFQLAKYLIQDASSSWKRSQIAHSRPHVPPTGNQPSSSQECWTEEALGARHIQDFIFTSMLILKRYSKCCPFQSGHVSRLNDNNSHEQWCGYFSHFLVHLISKPCKVTFHYFITCFLLNPSLIIQFLLRGSKWVGIPYILYTFLLKSPFWMFIFRSISLM